MNFADEALKSWLLLLITIAIFSIIGWSIGATGIVNLSIIEIIEIFIAIPVVAIAYYWLVSSKVSQFEKRVVSMEATFEQIMKEFKTEEDHLTDDQHDLAKEETTLKQDIHELRDLLHELNKDVDYLRKCVKPLKKKK